MDDFASYLAENEPESYLLSQALLLRADSRVFGVDRCAEAVMFPIQIQCLCERNRVP